MHFSLFKYDIETLYIGPLATNNQYYNIKFYKFLAPHFHKVYKIMKITICSYIFAQIPIFKAVKQIYIITKYKELPKIAKIKILLLYINYRI